MQRARDAVRYNHNIALLVLDRPVPTLNEDESQQKILDAQERARDGNEVAHTAAKDAAKVEPLPRTFFRRVMDQTFADLAYIFSPLTVPYKFVAAFFKGMNLAFYAGRALTCTIIFSGGAFVIDLGITFFLG